MRKKRLGHLFQEALARLAASPDARLYKHKGGFWSDEEGFQDDDMTQWAITTTDVKRLEKEGYIRFTSDSCAIVTEAGIAAL